MDPVRGENAPARASTLARLEDEIEQLPDADALMDEIDQMETVDAKPVPVVTSGSAAKYTVAGTPDLHSNGVVAEAKTELNPTTTTPVVAEEKEQQEQEGEGHVEKIYGEYSFFCIPRDNSARAFCKKILDDPRFDQVSLTIIGLNCLTLAMYDPLDPDYGLTENKVIQGLELCWTIFFTVEFVFKWFVMGFRGKGAYWEDQWNRLDFVIVMFGLVDFLPGGVEIPGTSALRTLRAIRPLRALNKFPSLRVLVNLLCDTLPQMASVAMLCFFIFFVFGILAVQIWSGLFRQRCYHSNMTLSSDFFGDANEDIFVCSISADQQNGMNTCPPDPCDNSAFNTCRRDGPNPAYGAIHFDHIFAAWVAIFQCITLEAWVDIMYLVQDGYGFWSWIYFVCLIIVGAWFAVNLCLVVISAQFGATKSDQLAQMAAQVVKERAEREKREKAERRRKKVTWIGKLRILVGYAPEPTPVDINREERVKYIESLEEQLEDTKDDETKTGLETQIENEDQALKALDDFYGDNDEEAASGVFLLMDRDHNNSIDIEEFKEHMKFKFHVSDDQCQQIFANMDTNADGTLSLEEFQTGYVAYKDSTRNICIRQRVRLRRVVMGDDFANFIMGAIAVNMVFMAIEFHGQPDELTTCVDIVNIIFCVLFAVEMVLKLLAIGVLEYISDGFNLFDGTIVIISLMELLGGGGGLSVLRTFRLVRVFRLISFLPTLQKQITVMIQTIGEVGSFLLILALFVFIIAIVGMFIFGGRFTWDEDTGNSCQVKADYVDHDYKWRDGCVTDRKNFDTFGWAMITVFQTLTQEDWNAGMYNGVRALGFPACIYFIFLIVFGNYILFNLFVAILIDGFAAPPEEEEEDTDSGMTSDQPPADQLPVDKVSTEVQPAVGTGTGTGSLDGSGVGCGTGSLSITVNPVRPRRTRRLIDQLMPGRVASNEALVARWKWGTARGPIEDRHRRRVEGPCVASHASSGHGSGVGTETAKEMDLIQGQDVVTTLATAETDLSKADTTKGDVINGDVVTAPEAMPVETAEAGCRSRDRSLFCFKPNNPCRVWCQEIVDDSTAKGKIFDRFIMGTIMFNSITLAMERPAVEDGSAERYFLDIAGNTFGFIFSVEFIMKIIAWNFMFGPREVSRAFKGPARYWDEGWNKLDGSLVMISWCDVLLSNLPGVDGGAIVGLLKIFRILRALRPLRAVNKLPGLKLVVNCLLASLGPIGTTLIIVATIFFIFGILGTQLFKGRMWYCNGVREDHGGISEDEIQRVRPLIGKDDCEWYNGYWTGSTNLTTSWTRHYYNFDNLGQSLMTLFVLSSIDGWVDIMYQGIDGVDEYKEPIENENEAMALFFIAFLLIGGFLILNMFVGVILENFNQAQEAEENRRLEGIANGTIQEVEVAAAPPKPDPLDGDFYLQYSACRRHVYNFVKNDTFDSVVAAVIISNVTIMATEHYDPAQWFKVFLKVQNYTFSVIFLFEFVVKVIAYGILYFGDNWCRFDFFLVLVSIFDLTTEFVDADLPVNPTILRVCRVMRIARILRLMKGQWAEDLRKLLVTVKNSLAQAGNLGLLMLLLYFISACLGIELFGRLACTEANPCEGMNNKANFEHFFIALLTLFRLSTGDNWNGILKDALREPPIVTPCNYALDCETDCSGGNNCCAGCDPSADCKENCCANAFMSVIYFVFFILAAQFVMLNLVVAVLMKELGDAEKLDAAEQAELEAKGDGPSSVEVLQVTQGAEEGKRRDFSETMQDGAKYWKRRFSNAHDARNVMYDFTNDHNKHTVETIKVENGEVLSQPPHNEQVPQQTGQTCTSPGPPLTSGESEAPPTERPPTRSAWEQ